jgi:hypothetical protein
VLKEVKMAPEDLKVMVRDLIKSNISPKSTVGLFQKNE